MWMPYGKAAIAERPLLTGNSRRVGNWATRIGNRRAHLLLEKLPSLRHIFHERRNLCGHRRNLFVLDRAIG